MGTGLIARIKRQRKQSREKGIKKQKTTAMKYKKEFNQLFDRMWNEINKEEE